MPKPILIALISLLVLGAAVIVLAQAVPLPSAVRIVVALPYLLFLPGFIWTFVFIKKNQPGIDWIERLALSFALSLFVLPIVAFVLNRFGVPITTTSIFLQTLVLSVAGAIIILFKRQEPKTHANG